MERQRCAFALAVVLLAPAACGTAVTEEECRAIGESLRSAWEAEARRAASANEAATSNAAVVLETEARNLASEWNADCRSELVGRRVNADELACLRGARTLAALRGCNSR